MKCPCIERECIYCVATTGHVCNAPVYAMLRYIDGKVICTQEEVE